MKKGAKFEVKLINIYQVMTAVKDYNIPAGKFRAVLSGSERVKKIEASKVAFFFSSTFFYSMSHFSTKKSIFFTSQ